jgi:hypothetical protein
LYKMIFSLSMKNGIRTIPCRSCGKHCKNLFYTLQRKSSAYTLERMPLTQSRGAGGSRHSRTSIPRPQFHLERRPAPGPALSAAQPRFEIDQAGVARPAPRQRRRGDFSLMPAYPSAHPDHMPDAQALKPECIAGRRTVVHVRCLFLSAWAFSRQEPPALPARSRRRSSSSSASHRRASCPACRRAASQVSTVADDDHHQHGEWPARRARIMMETN